MTSAQALDYDSGGVVGTRTLTLEAKDDFGNATSREMTVVFATAPHIDQDGLLMRTSVAPMGRPLALSLVAHGRDVSSLPALPAGLDELLGRSLDDVAAAVGSTPRPRSGLCRPATASRRTCGRPTPWTAWSGTYDAAVAHSAFAALLGLGFGGEAPGQAVGASNPSALAASGVGVTVRDEGTYAVRVAEDSADVGVDVGRVQNTPLLAARVERYQSSGQLQASANPSLRFSTGRPENPNRSYVVWRRMGSGRWVQQSVQAGLDSGGNVVLDK